MDLLSTRQTIQWVKNHAKIGNADIEINKKFLKTLEETGRLFPAKKSIFGRKYALDRLVLYAHDVAPR